MAAMPGTPTVIPQRSPSPSLSSSASAQQPPRPQRPTHLLSSPPQPGSHKPSNPRRPSRPVSTSTFASLDSLPPIPPSALRPTPKQRKSDALSRDEPTNLGEEGEEGDSDQDLQDGEGDSLITRVLVTPLLTISFILSLVLIDNRMTRRLRSSSSSSNSTSYLSFSTLTSSAPSSTSSHPSAGKDEDAPPPDAVHAKHRKIFRMELTDAFAARDRVLVALVIVGLLAVFGLGVAVWWVLGWMRERLLGGLSGVGTIVG